MTSVQLGNTYIADMDKCPQDKCCLDKSRAKKYGFFAQAKKQHISWDIIKSILFCKYLRKGSSDLYEILCGGQLLSCELKF